MLAFPYNSRRTLSVYSHFGAFDRFCDLGNSNSENTIKTFSRQQGIGAR